MNTNELSTQEILDLAEKEYDGGFYDDAIKYYSMIHKENAEAASTMALCMVNYAGDVSEKALRARESNDDIFQAQKETVNILSEAISTALYVYRKFPDDLDALNTASSALSTAFYLHYTLVSTGLTIAYNVTQHEITVDSVLQIGSTLWIDLTETTENFTSFESIKFENYHIFGPDEKTKDIRKQLATVIENAKKVARILTLLGREYDAHMLRASVACAAADCDGGDRRYLLAAKWFVLRAKELAQQALSSEDYENWNIIHNATVTDTCDELIAKNDVLLRSYRKDGIKPPLATFYDNETPLPTLDSCQSYMIELDAYKTLDQKDSKGDFFKMFLNVFAQIPFKTIFPTILFASIVSLFCGGLFHIFSADAGIFTRIFGIVWLIITFVLTFIRGKMNSDEFRTDSTHRTFMAIMLLTALLFSINFFLGLVPYVVLKVISAKYK